MLLTEDELRSSQAGQPLPLAPKWARWFHAFVDAGFLRSYLNGTTGEPWNVSAGARVAASGATTRSTSRAGRATSVSNGQIAAHTPNQSVTLGAFTLLGVGYIGAASGATTQVLAASADLNSPIYQADIVFNRTTGTIQARVYKSATLTLDSGVTFEYGRVYSCALTVIAGDARLYVDGSLRASDTGAGFVTYTTFRHLCLGNSEYTNANLNGGVLLGGVSKFFSPREAESLSRNPWQVFGAAHGIPIDSAAASGATINATVGNAVAAGSAATVSSAITVAATTGNAAAAGATASVASSITIAATVGNAAAAGSTAAIESSVTIGAGIGNAVAAGATASIPAGASVDCTVGDAVAAGAQATISSAITIAANVGNSVAAGSTADVSTATVVACTTGNATAAGLAASISGTVSIVCSVGDAVAAGSAASITATGALNAAEIADAVWDEPMVDAITARTIMSGMADFLRSRGHLP